MDSQKKGKKEKRKKGKKRNPTIDGVETLERKKLARDILEALSEEARICSVNPSPKLKKLAGLTLSWNISLSEGYSINERIVIAERIINEVDAKLWSR